MGQSLARLLPVSLPRAEGMCSDNEHSIFGQALSRELHQPIFNFRREGSGPLDIETQLNAGRSLIYMLPSRTGRLDVTFREFPFVEGDRLSYTHEDLIYSLMTIEGADLETQCRRFPWIESEINPFSEIFCGNKDWATDLFRTQMGSSAMCVAGILRNHL